MPAPYKSKGCKIKILDLPFPKKYPPQSPSLPWVWGVGGGG